MGSEQVVYIATVHALRHIGVAAAQRHGKACLVETPMTINAPMARIMIDRAKKDGLFLMEVSCGVHGPGQVKRCGNNSKENEGGFIGEKGKRRRIIMINSKECQNGEEEQRREKEREREREDDEGERIEQEI